MLHWSWAMLAAKKKKLTNFQNQHLINDKNLVSYNLTAK